MILFSGDYATASKHHARMPFCAWRRFSASSNTTDCGPSITSSVPSSPPSAGRQCINRPSGIAGRGDGAALYRTAMLFEGHQVSHDLARMRAPGQAVDDGYGGVRGELQQRIMVENADHDGVDIARQHPRGVGDGLAAAELHFRTRQHDRFPAELAHADVERHPGAG